MTNENFLFELERIIADRIANPRNGSYTASLASAGTRRIAQKVGEEAVELALASVGGKRNEVLDEAADLLYHLLVLLQERHVGLVDVACVLQARHENRHV